MKVIETIKSRHSVRKYSDQEVPLDTIFEILDAVRNAPTWANGREVRFSIIENKDMRAELLKVSEYNSKYIERAPVLIVVSALKNVVASGDTFSHTSLEWTMFDCGIAVDSLLLAAWERGIGSVVLGDYNLEILHQATRLPDTEIPIAIVCLGYPAYPPKGPAKLALDDMVRVIEEEQDAL